MKRSKKISKANKGRKHSEEVGAKHREYMNQRWQDQEYRLEHSKRMKELNARPEYKQKQIDSHSGDKSWNALAVINVDTHKIYGAGQLAADATGIDNSSILRCCKGQRKYAGGYNWKYINDYTTANGTVIPGAITLGIVTRQEVAQQLNQITV